MLDHKYYKLKYLKYKYKYLQKKGGSNYESFIDGKTNKTYYYNNETGETTWEKPNDNCRKTSKKKCIKNNNCTWIKWDSNKQSGSYCKKKSKKSKKSKKIFKKNIKKG